MKVYYRSSTILNCLNVLILSVLSLYLLTSILGEKSLWDKDNVFSFFLHFKIHFVIVLISFIGIFQLKKWSLYFFAISGVSLLFHHGIILYENFNKLSLLFITLFATLFFYFYFLLKKDLKKAYVRSYFSKNYVEGKPQIALKVSLKTKNQSLEGTLVNWDKKGCFIALNSPIQPTKEKIWLDFPYENRIFQDQGIIATISRNKKFIGVYIKNKNHFSDEKKFKWLSLIQILTDRAITPERIY